MLILPEDFISSGTITVSLRSFPPQSDMLTGISVCRTFVFTFNHSSYKHLYWK